MINKSNKSNTSYKSNLSNTSYWSYTSNTSNTSYWSYFVLLALIFSFFPLTKTTHAATISRPPSNLGLVGYWPMDEGSGTLARDSSGQGNTGVITGATWTEGKRGKALSFNGSSSSVDLGNPGILNFSNTITISAWVKLNSWSNFPGIISKGYATNGGYSIHVRSDYSVWFELDESNSTRHFYNPTNTVLALNTWNLVTCTYDGATLRVYINGSQVGTGSNAVFNIGTISNSVVIGKLLGYGTFNGPIDDVRIYNRALSATEVSAIYKSGQVTKKQASNEGLVGYWSMNEGAGTRTNDSSGRGNIGRLLGTTIPTWVNGKHGKALNFGGDDYVEVADNPSLNPGSSSLTVSVWFKMNSAGTTDNSILYNKENLFEASAGGGYFTYAWQPHWAWDGGTSFPVNVGEWYHAVVVYDKTKQYVYKNGVQVYSRDQTGDTGTNSSALRIGARGAPGAAFAFFNGLIDDVRVYNRALSAAEVQNLYGSGQVTYQNPSNQGLVGYWPMEEGVGTKAGDASGNSNHGSVTGATWTDGKRGKALSFDGAADYVTSNSSAISLGANDFSISFWTYRTASGYQDGSYFRKSIDGSNSANPGFDTYDGMFRVNTSTGYLARISMSASYNVWQHHTFVVNQSTSPYINHYINGVLDQTGYSETGNKGSVDNAQKLILGWSFAGGVNRYFNGKMDEFRIFNRALSATEVLQLYNSK